ncbi:restriction endonuclease subunit S [Empedobacter falsenii]
MELVNLVDICDPKQWKTISKKVISEQGSYPVYGANGKMGYYDKFNHQYPTLLIGCRGTCGSLHITDEFSYTNGNAMSLDNLKDSVDIKFLYYYLSFRGFNDVISGGVQKQITRENLKRVKVPLPSLEEQKAIAARLDKADEIRQLNQQIINHYDELIQALFIDMFGDPVKNEKGWEKKKFGELGNFKNGLNYNKVDKGYKIKVIGVGDFKNYWKIENNNKISTIDIDSRPNNEFNLKVNDLVFVRSNGNKDLVGRCIIYKNNILDEDVSFSGFCIRFRSESNLLNPNFLIHKLQLKSFRKVVFKNGRGANIQNINQQLLSNIKLYIPPIKLQNQFAERVEKIEAQKELAVQALQQSEDLFNSLLQQAFKK